MRRSTLDLEAVLTRAESTTFLSIPALMPNPSTDVSNDSNPGDKVSFSGENGQALLLAVGSGRTEDLYASLIPVYRPSKHWADTMVNLETAGQKVLGEKARRQASNVERWKEIRNDNSGEREAEIWKRIHRHVKEQLPFVCRYIPFWRPLAVSSERQFLVYRVVGPKYIVDVTAHLDIEAIRTEAENILQQAMVDRESDFPEESIDCRGSFDAFGKWYATQHDPKCWLISPDDDLLCYGRRFEEASWQLTRLERHLDFFRCFRIPEMSNVLKPLTGGRLMNSCIRDQRSIRHLRLPIREDPTRLSVPVNGIYIEYGVLLTSFEMAMSGSTCLVLIVVLGWKVATGDWSVAAGFGSLVVALLGLAYNQRAVMLAEKGGQGKAK